MLQFITQINSCASKSCPHWHTYIKWNAAIINVIKYATRQPCWWICTYNYFKVCGGSASGLNMCILWYICEALLLYFLGVCLFHVIWCMIKILPAAALVTDDTDTSFSEGGTVFAVVTSGFFSELPSSTVSAVTCSPSESGTAHTDQSAWTHTQI